jgi:hypothetical protein
MAALHGVAWTSASQERQLLAGARLEARALFGGLDRLAKAPPYVAFGLLWTMRPGHAVEGLLPPLKQTSVLVANMSA